MAAHPRIIDRSQLLRSVLQTNSVVSAAAGITLLVGAPLLSPWLGLSTELLRFFGAVFLPFAAGVWYTAARTPLNRRTVVAIIIADTSWVVLSIAALLAGWLPLTDAGWWLIIAQAVITGLFADLQAIGMWRAR
jgi:Kef-type K+ transport system membrane component KefB